MDDALFCVSSATASAEWLGSRTGRDTLGVQVLNAIGTYAAAPAFGLKSSPVLSIVCIITASLRATAAPQVARLIETPPSDLCRPLTIPLELRDFRLYA